MFVYVYCMVYIITLHNVMTQKHLSVHSCCRHRLSRHIYNDFINMIIIISYNLCWKKNLYIHVWKKQENNVKIYTCLMAYWCVYYMNSFKSLISPTLRVHRTTSITKDICILQITLWIIVKFLTNDKYLRNKTKSNKFL